MKLEVAPFVAALIVVGTIVGALVVANGDNDSIPFQTDSFIETSPGPVPDPEGPVPTQSEGTVPNSQGSVPTQNEGTVPQRKGGTVPGLARGTDPQCRGTVPNRIGGTVPGTGGTVPRGGGKGAVPRFSGFDSARYQGHDALIRKLTAEFNANRAKWAGAEGGQAQSLPVLSPSLVKAHIIQESGGNSSRCRAAWAVDPAQVNVPGDWTPYKKYLGLRKPRHRNEGTLEGNLRAAIKFLTRKGFGQSGQPAANRPDAHFDGWSEALRRYNGRTDKLPDGRPYRQFYGDTILKRAANPEQHIRIEP